MLDLLYNCFMNELIPVQNLIYEIRGHKVMLDSDLASLYGVEVKRLNEAVKRNIIRFPNDFMFQLTKDEWQNLRSQIATLSNDKRKYTPYVFTEQGVSMLSSVLNSEQAIAINIQIMRVFVQIKQFALTNKDLTKRLDEMEYKFIQYAREMNINIEDIYRQLNFLTDITKPSKIGFETEK
jgi:hypothetical protein